MEELGQATHSDERQLDETYQRNDRAHFPTIWVGRGSVVVQEVQSEGGDYQPRQLRELLHGLDHGHGHGREMLGRLKHHWGGVLGQQHHRRPPFQHFRARHLRQLHWRRVRHFHCN
jgi:hypothetical protein